ncbi:MAG TPA: hypothetical protein DEF41_15425 [Desulfovibrio sp.]|nr:hypothetical protein [Desulfovibrio sp.]
MMFRFALLAASLFFQNSKKMATPLLEFGVILTLL